MQARYFDNAATTPVDPRVREAMLPHLNEAFGNANSIHRWGAEAHAAVERAREEVALLLGADPEEIVFTSGATEANNWVVRAFEDVKVSPFEHSSMVEAARHLGKGVLENDGLELTPPAEAELVSVMLVNNEIGTIWGEDVLNDSRWRRHSDVTQAVGKVPLEVWQFDYASFSAHKFHGPKGVGGLYIRHAEPIEPLMYGGEHENGLRAGTLNVPAIVGMGEAAKIARDVQQEDYQHADDLRGIVVEELRSVRDCRINGGPKVSPFILSASFAGVEGEALVIETDRRGFAISSGAACSSRSTEPSHVLTALGVEESWLRGTVRISFGRFTTKEAAADLAKALREAVEQLRKMND